MKVAHIIMAHKGPIQLQRLIERLQHPQFDIYVHIDAKIDQNQFTTVIKETDHVRFIKNRLDCNWGGFSFLKAIFGAIGEVLDSGIKYDFINLMSAQDYPINRPEQIYDFLAAHTGKNFISFDDSDESDWWKHAAKRYELYHLTDFSFKGQYLIQNLINKLTPTRKIPGNLKLYGGSKACWWTITGDCATYLRHTFNNSPKLYNFLKFTWGSDEFVIPTLIMNSPFKSQVVNDNLRYIDWSEKKAHPKLLSITDYENVINSSMLFARKFDIEFDSHILNRIDQELNG